VDRGAVAMAIAVVFSAETLGNRSRSHHARGGETA